MELRTLVSAPGGGQLGGGARDWDVRGQGIWGPRAYQGVSPGSWARDGRCRVPLYLAHVQGLGARVLLHHEELVPHPAALDTAHAQRAVLLSPGRRRWRARRPQVSQQRYRRRQQQQQQQQQWGRQRDSGQEPPAVRPRPHAWAARGPRSMDRSTRASLLGGTTERRPVTWWPQRGRRGAAPDGAPGQARGPERRPAAGALGWRRRGRSCTPGMDGLRGPHPWLPGTTVGQITPQRGRITRQRLRSSRVCCAPWSFRRGMLSGTRRSFVGSLEN